MPKVIKYQRSETIPGDAPNVAAPLSLGQDVDKATVEIGDALSSGVDKIQHRQAVLRRQDLDNEALSIGAKYDAEHYSFVGQEQVKTGRDSFGNVERGQKFTADSLAKFTEGIDNSYLKQRVEQHILARSGTMLGTLAHHQASQRQKVRDDALNATLDVTKKAAYLGYDTLPNAIDRFNKAVKSQVDNGSRGSDNAENILIKAQSEIADSYLDGVVNRNPQGAVALIRSGMFNQYLKKERIDEFDKKANLLVDAQERDARTATKEAEQAREKQRKLQREAIGNEFVARQAAGKLTRTDILKSDLEPTGENSKTYWLNQIEEREKKLQKNPGGFVTDRAVEATMYSRIVRDPESVNDGEILNLIGKSDENGRGGLSHEDAKKLIDEKRTRLKEPKDPAETAVLDNLKRDRNAGVFGKGPEGDLEYAKQIESFKRWRKAHTKEDPSVYYETITTPYKQGLIGQWLDFAWPDKVDPKKRREQMTGGTIPKGQGGGTRKLVGYKNGKPVYDLGNGTWQVGD